MKKLLVLSIIAFFSIHTMAQKSADDALAAQFYQTGEFDKAATIYEKLFHKNLSLYYDPYLNSLLKLKRLDDAEKVVKSMMKVFPENFTYQVDYGKLVQEKGQQDKAYEWYNSLVKKVPQEEYAVRELAIAFYRAEAYDYSIKTLLNGRKNLNNESAFAYDLISLYRYQKNKPMLIQEYLNLLGEKDAQEQAMNQAKNTFLTVLEESEDYALLRTALLKKIQKDPQNVYYSELLAWQYIQQKDFDQALRQTIAIDKRLKEEGDRVYDLSLLLIGNKAYNTAIEALQYLTAKGSTNQYYIPAKIQLLNTKNQIITAGSSNVGQLHDLENEYKQMIQEFGKTRNTIFALRQLATLQANHLDKPKEAAALLEDALKTPGLPPSTIAQIKLELGDIYILTSEVWEAALMYGQVEKDFAGEPVGQEAKFKNAKLSYYQGDFAWAKAQLDVLKSSTSQLIANDALNLSLLVQENTSGAADTNALKKYARADLFSFMNQDTKALLVLDSINTLFPGNSLADDILMAKAKIYLKQNNLEMAVKQLDNIVSNCSFDLWADDAIFTLGDLYETKLNDPEKAKIYYQRIITDYPGSLYVTEARKRFRNLRGDNIG